MPILIQKDAVTSTVNTNTNQLTGKQSPNPKPATSTTTPKPISALHAVAAQACRTTPSYNSLVYGASGSSASTPLASSISNSAGAATPVASAAAAAAIASVAPHLLRPATTSVNTIPQSRSNQTTLPQNYSPAANTGSPSAKTSPSNPLRQASSGVPILQVILFIQLWSHMCNRIPWKELRRPTP